MGELGAEISRCHIASELDRPDRYKTVHGHRRAQVIAAINVTADRRRQK